MSALLEVIAVTPDEARVIEAAGADRIELVSALGEGGLTPGFGLMKRVVLAVRIPVNVMIRPHSRGFHYSPEDLEVMKEEILAAREARANGVVLGLLEDHARVDTKNLEALLAVAGGLEVTFHRAIDVAQDAVEAIRVLARYPPIRTVLTSGGRGRIEDNVATLARMRENAGHLRIMAGGGLNLENITRIAESAAPHDFHYGTAVRLGRAIDGEILPEPIARLKRMISGASV
jgi:copper homeostasis protein